MRVIACVSPLGIKQNRHCKDTLGHEVYEDKLFSILKGSRLLHFEAEIYSSLQKNSYRFLKAKNVFLIWKPSNTFSQSNTAKYYMLVPINLNASVEREDGERGRAEFTYDFLRSKVVAKIHP